MNKFTENLPKKYTKSIWRAIMEFDMISVGDRIMVGFSGGKDSAFLLYALKVLQKQNVLPYELAAVTIDPQFAGSSLKAHVHELCQELEIPYYYEALPQFEELIFNQDKSQNACAQCAFFRRGAINRLAAEHGYNKLALGHHHDDAVETFLMSILHSGQITTFLPVTPQDRSGITVIRPLIYLREKEILKAKEFFPYQAVDSCCPLDGNSTRSKIKDLIKELNSENKSLYNNLGAAMRVPKERVILWPPVMKREEMREAYLKKMAWKREK